MSSEHTELLEMLELEVLECLRREVEARIRILRIKFFVREGAHEELLMEIRS